MQPLWIIGSGGHAKVVIEAARLSNDFEVAGCLDDTLERIGAEVLGVPVIGDTSDFALERLGVHFAVLAIGSNAARNRIARRLEGMVRWATIVHPRAWVSASAAIGQGSVVMAGATIQADTCVGSHAILNTACSVDHDCAIGSFVHIGPGVHLAGDVRVGEGAFLGTGANVIPGVAIGSWSVVGAGAVVIADVLENAVVYGVPARVSSVYSGE